MLFPLLGTLTNSAPFTCFAFLLKILAQISLELLYHNSLCLCHLMVYFSSHHLSLCTLFLLLHTFRFFPTCVSLGQWLVLTQWKVKEYLWAYIISIVIFSREMSNPVILLFGRLGSSSAEQTCAWLEVYYYIKGEDTLPFTIYRIKKQAIKKDLT